SGTDGPGSASRGTRRSGGVPFCPPPRLDGRLSSSRLGAGSAQEANGATPGKKRGPVDGPGDHPQDLRPWGRALLRDERREPGHHRSIRQRRGAETVGGPSQHHVSAPDEAENTFDRPLRTAPTSAINESLESRPGVLGCARSGSQDGSERDYPSI